jgi:hypothetical protein
MLPFMAPIAGAHPWIGATVGAMILVYSLLSISGGMYRLNNARPGSENARIGRLQIRNAWRYWIPLGTVALFLGGYALVIVAVWFLYALAQAGEGLLDSFRIAFARPQQGMEVASSERFPTQEDIEPK